MFFKIAVALNSLPESQRVLRTAIALALASTICTLRDLPAYTSFAIVVGSSAPNAMNENRQRA
jgi:hypothetical protein